jgi:hypothetical protein
LESKSIIMKNYSKLADLLDTDDDLICEMLSRECFTVYQLINIANTSDLCERNKKLLDLVLSGSVATLARFTECLQTTQPHLIPLLTGNTGKQWRFYVGAGGHRPPQMLARPPQIFGQQNFFLETGNQEIIELSILSHFACYLT